MKLVNEFGINPVLLGAQIVNFLILLYLLRRFLYRPVLKLLESRKKTIEETLRNAEEARLHLEKAKEEERKILQRAQKLALKIVEDAKKQKEAIQKEANATATAQAEKILLEANEKIENIARDVEARLTAHVSTVAVTLLKKSLQGLLTQKNQHDVLEVVTKGLTGRPN